MYKISKNDATRDIRLTLEVPEQYVAVSYPTFNKRDRTYHIDPEIAVLYDLPYEMHDIDGNYTITHHTI